MFPAPVGIPSPLENQMPEENTPRIEARLGAAVANGPITSAADEILNGRSVSVVPDIPDNAGGVTVRYLEWLQNRPGR
jgi:glutamate dehydrogenase (NADP+)